MSVAMLYTFDTIVNCGTWSTTELSNDHNVIEETEMWFVRRIQRGPRIEKKGAKNAVNHDDSHHKWVIIETSRTVIKAEIICSDNMVDSRRKSQWKIACANPDNQDSDLRQRDITT